MQKQKKRRFIRVVMYQLYGNMHMRCDCPLHP